MFNVYGPRQSISNPYQGVLAIFIGNVLRDEPITIHGDGEQTRDFVFVDDVVEAWVRVLDAPELDGAVLNVGSGSETSVNELADAVLAASGDTRDGWEIKRAGRSARRPAASGRRHHGTLVARLERVGLVPRRRRANGGVGASGRAGLDADVRAGGVEHIDHEARCARAAHREPAVRCERSGGEQRRAVR